VKEINSRKLPEETGSETVPPSTELTPELSIVNSVPTSEVCGGAIMINKPKQSEKPGGEGAKVVQ
jgi:hypothetical protein